MNTQRLITIDNWFKPIYLLLERLKNLAPSKKESISTIVILKFFGLGSITRIVYVIEQANISKQKVRLITLKQNQTIVEQLGVAAWYIKTNSIFHLAGSVFRCVVKIWRLRHAAVLDMERSAYLSGIFRLVVSIGKPCSSFFFGSENRKKGNQTFISLTDKPAIKAIAEMLEHESDFAFPARSSADTPNQEVLVNINAGDYLSERRFPLHQFVNLIVILHRRFPEWSFVLTGSREELIRTAALRNLLLEKQVDSNRIINEAGKQTISELTVRLKNSFLFITNDSGPLHLAQYLRIKTVGIWGPTSSYLVGYPNSEHMLNLDPDTECAPCFLHPKSKVAKHCNGAVTCFESMKADVLAERIAAFVHRGKHSDPKNSSHYSQSINTPDKSEFLNRDA